MRWLCLSIALLAVTVARAALQETFESEYEAARKEAVTQLVTFADWCGQNKLFAERDKAYESIVTLDPTHEAAHKALKHVKQHDGTWNVPEKKNPPKNSNPGALEECVKRRTEIATALIDRAAALMQFYDKKVLPAHEQRVLDDVLIIDADNAPAHARRGEVQVEGNWVLQETVTAKERRGALKAQIQAAITAVPTPASCDPTERELGLGIAWKQAVSVPSNPDAKVEGFAASKTKVRVLCTGSPEEARKVAVMCSVAADVFRAITGAPRDLPPNYTVYIVTNPTDRDTFITKWPGWSDDERKALKNWAGAGVPNHEPHVVRWDTDEARRLDGAVRHTLGLMTLWNFDFDHRQAAWIWEGFGLYLTRELVGTRFTWYGSGPTTGDPDAKELLGKLMISDVNWMNECYQRGKRGKTQPLAKLFERKIDQLGVDDVLLSYAFSAYLVEGRPEAVPAIFKNLQKQGAAASVTSATGADLPVLDVRLVRWLAERK